MPVLSSITVIGAAPTSAANDELESRDIWNWFPINSAADGAYGQSGKSGGSFV